MRRAFTALITAVLAATLLAGCGGDHWATKCTTTAGVTECAPDQRPAAREVRGELLASGQYDIRDDRGKVIVVNFWASWCSPCRAEADDLEKTYAATKDRGVTFLGVNWRDDRDAAKAFERGRVTYPSIFDPRGRVGVEFEVTQANLPTTLIIDRQGRVAMMLRQATVAGALQPLVERIAAEEPG